MKKKLLVYVSLAVLLANLLPTAVSAVENHNSSRSNKTFPIAIGGGGTGGGVGEEGIKNILDATDDELQVSVDYNSSRSNVKLIIKGNGSVGGDVDIRNLRSGGLDDASAEAIVNAIVEKNADEVWNQPTRINVSRTEFKTFTERLLSTAPVMKDEEIQAAISGAKTPARAAILAAEQIRAILGKRPPGPGPRYEDLTVKIADAAGALIQPAENYNTAREKVVATMRKYGVKDDRIPELLDIAYIPVRVSEAFGDDFGAELESYPVLKDIFGSAKTNVYLRISSSEKRPFGEAIFSVVTRDRKVGEAAYGEIFENQSPTLNVYMGQETLDRITAGEITPLDALWQGKMGYQGVGFLRSVKVNVMKAVLRVLKLVGVSPQVNRASRPGGGGGVDDPPPMEGDPVPGVDISLEQIPGGIVQATTSDGGGQFTFNNVAAGAYVITVKNKPGGSNKAFTSVSVSPAGDGEYLLKVTNPNTTGPAPAASTRGYIGGKGGEGRVTGRVEVDSRLPLK
ncbi:MAG: carboxypeptidase regulatory-like domain-containing protein [Chloroflexi bacterium]|nr:carboxypeptidase regulatory-like domain-containing protein [Chloroflexota bacterium]